MTAFHTAAARAVTAHTSSWDMWRTSQPPGVTARRAQRQLLTDPIVVKLTLASSEVGVVVHEPEPTWLYPVLDRLKHLSRLTENWDSYGGSTPSDESIYTTLAVLSRVLRDESVAPAIVPLSEGGLQVEWHRDGEELEIRVNEDGVISAFRFDEEAGRGYEVDHVTLTDLSPLLALTGQR